MRKYVFTVICVFLYLQAIPMVSAQVQLPPPNYSLYCDSQVNIDVDPETSTPPREIIDCLITNEESYSLELSISSGTHVLTIEHDDSIVVPANGEETFQVEIDAEDRMLVSTYALYMSTEVTKTGEIDYSDDEPLTYGIMIQILQYAAFTLEPQQVDNDQKLIDDEYFEISYIITNNGNFNDRFTMNTYSYATPICDEEQTFESSNNDASGCILMTPVSNNCDEELDVKMMSDWSDDWEERSSMRWEADIGQSLSFMFRISLNVENSTCWLEDPNGNNHLEFTHVVRAYSDFGLRGWYDSNDDWGQYDHSPIRIERSVEATKSNDEGILGSSVPGFGSPYLLLCLFFTAIIHQRKSSQ